MKLKLVSKQLLKYSIIFSAKRSLNKVNSIKQNLNNSLLNVQAYLLRIFHLTFSKKLLNSSEKKLYYFM